MHISKAGLYYNLILVLLFLFAKDNKAESNKITQIILPVILETIKFQVICRQVATVVGDYKSRITRCDVKVSISKIYLYIPTSDATLDVS